MIFAPLPDLPIADDMPIATALMPLSWELIARDYSPESVRRIVAFAARHGSIQGCSDLDGQEDIDAAEETLPMRWEISVASDFFVYELGPEA